MKKIWLVIALILGFQFTYLPAEAADTNVIRLVTEPNRNYSGFFYSDDLATRLTPTGDLGKLDEDGYLFIVGRKKELIVTAGGKNVAPAVLEDRLRAHPLVSQCVVVGDARPFIGALITIDQEALKSWIGANKKQGASMADLAVDQIGRAHV